MKTNQQQHHEPIDLHNSFAQPSKYNVYMRAAHWLVALFIISMLAVGFYMTRMEGPERFEIYALHKSFGLIMLALIVVRITTRAYSKLPKDPPVSKIELFLFKSATLLFYIMMLTMPISGMIMSFTSGYGISFFGIPMPNPFTVNTNIARTFNAMHEYCGYLLAGLIVVHITASAKHYFLDKVNLYKRII